MKIKILIFISALAFVFSGCIKNKSYKTFSIYRPEYAVKQSVRDNATLQSAVALGTLGNFVIYNNTMYVNEKGKGIHVVDYSNASSPVNKGFIPIPGNTGVSIKNNVLYADCFTDLFVFNIISNSNIQLKNTVTNVFTSRVGYSNYDKNYVDLTWNKRDTTVTLDEYNRYYNNCYNCMYEDGMIYATNTSNTSSSSNNVPSGGNSVGSSMAVFAIVNDYLYTLDATNLYAFSLKDAINPTLESMQFVNWAAETLYPFKDKLFLGTTTGMYIYGLQNPASPNYISMFTHARLCDPVIADDKYAFVTLRSSTRCGGNVNAMDVLNIEDVSKPSLITTVNFSNPHGLSKDGNVLFICDGAAGLKVMDATNVNSIVMKQNLSVGNALDVIAYNQLAIVMLDNAIKFYSYDNQFNVTYLSTLNLN